MFSLGFFEIILLLALALVFLGPEKLPALAKEIARFIHQIRSIKDNVDYNLSSKTHESSESAPLNKDKLDS